ncbi:MAG: hypothetical protein A3J38_09765 [Gammaproteobacteria bacterium RIFCSPHIGHO2_12_FULL_45_9]|nr:MAG: hypothetical protein A3J38_09765 [Gammaproteobacteria bacterium RIFCSPHIGHO2_12_FULL_45_9]
MQRTLASTLTQWRHSATRKPLLVRGARQVGKSFLIEAFGKQHFDHCITINFELNPEYKKCFQTLNPQEICDNIRVVSQQKIVAQQTLLFLDEIQDCPAAIQALRYFKEQMPELHVIGAGSLLELVLRQAEFRLPVGRVGFLYLYPVSFKEFLTAVNPTAVEQLEQCSVAHPLTPAVHDYLQKQLRLYFFVGGMPEALASYMQLSDIQEVQAIQASILATFRNDFGHYSEWANPKHLQLCFDQVPQLIGQQIKYNKIDPDIRARELKEALQVLEDISLIHKIRATAASGIPLDATLNEKKFKLSFLDIGLVKRIQKLDASLLLDENMMLLNRGSLAEQFVGQELLAYSPAFEKASLYFWARDGAGHAEVDYLVQMGADIIPLEVKAGKTGTLRSLKQFILERNPPLSLRISEQPLALSQNILSVPFYLISELPRLISPLR